MELCRQMVRPRARLQCFGDGPAGPFARGPVQLLLAPLHHEDGVDARRPDDWSYRIRPLEKLHSQGHQTR